ncbi:MAG: class II D-tagatose-bisphosphate aldolase, non-catalytic subunit [Clostridiaceae bacterium]|nr:class II D-tagatose-bisphosphate aldolase, non-catalytic subunit [Eubacteriales bacterium]
MHELKELVALQKRGVKRGICSVCSSSPFVIDAALLQAKEAGTALLLEATANQVNQFGGYTGMTPQDFRDRTLSRARAAGLPEERLILGGDHLGPVAWRGCPAAEAMENGAALVRAFALAGYSKIHLDASMPLGGDALLTTEEIARRTATLCRAAEEGYLARKKEHSGAAAPVYVIGSEVPTPGGSGTENELSVTRPEALTDMLCTFEAAFAESGLTEAWTRVIAAVVQPGVEFGNDEIHEYEPEAAAELVAAVRKLKNVVLEGHSTDYQTEASLRRLVEDGVAILKVGPALTFACREALFALSYIELELDVKTPSRFMETLEKAMRESPGNWASHYPKDAPNPRLLRRFSLSDRSRYYMAAPAVEQATERLLKNLEETGIPLALISQFFPMQYTRVRRGALAAQPRALVLDKVRETLAVYWRACGY